MSTIAARITVVPITSAPRITALVATTMGIVAAIMEAITAIITVLGILTMAMATIGARTTEAVTMAIIGVFMEDRLPGRGLQRRITTMTAWPTACVDSGHMTL